MLAPADDTKRGEGPNMMDRSLRRLGILTGGGDCPGLNAVIRAVAKPAMNDYGATVMGIEDGFEGMVEGRARELTNAAVSGIINQGGTILGTTNKGDPWHYPSPQPDGSIRVVDVSARVLKHYEELQLDALVAIGGDGTMHIAHRLAGLGLNVVGVPKTIDNDIARTDLTFGHDSAVYAATLALDRLHTTASSHHRVMVCEVMGRYAGWIALSAGLASGADIILLPEIDFTWEAVCRKVAERNRYGKRFSIVCIAEGARLPGGEEVVAWYDEARTDTKRLGGVGEVVARRVQEETGIESRVTVLGHLLRGGSPTAYDRVLATRYGAMACKLAAERQFGMMAALHGTAIVPVSMEDAVARQKRVPPDHQMIQAARSVGTSMGD